MCTALPALPLASGVPGLLEAPEGTTECHFVLKIQTLKISEAYSLQYNISASCCVDVSLLVLLSVYNATILILILVTPIHIHFSKMLVKLF
jgi:hypothetical protein